MDELEQTAGWPDPAQQTTAQPGNQNSQQGGVVQTTSEQDTSQQASWELDTSEQGNWEQGDWDTAGAFDPLAAYEQQFAPAYAKASAELFDTMVTAAGIDVDANEVLNLRINRASEELSAQASALRKLQWQRALAIVGGCLAVALPWIVSAIANSQGMFLLWWGWLITALVAAGLATFAFRAAYVLTPVIRSSKTQVAETTATRDSYIAEARRGLAPLQHQYRWNMLDGLSESSIPGLKLDQYVTYTRQDDLSLNYGLANPIGSNSSVLATQSGTYQNNPFVLFQVLNFQMGWKTYTGAITISWQELETYSDANGRSQTRMVTRTQVLTASVQKPFPEYYPTAFLVYGTEATPDLHFSRTPSKLSKLGDSKSANRKVERTVKKLEKQSRKGTQDNNFTVMANKDFAALFHATDRNDEIQYRVLFTPVAQQQMVNLLRDNRLGYGDNFAFQKTGKVITVWPNHLPDAALTEVPAPTPESDEHWNLAAQRERFHRRSMAQFRDRYFALAPVLAVPLLHEPRTTAQVPPAPAPASWEQEAIANRYRGSFRHPESVTEDIIKTQVINETDGNCTLQVTAAGFRGIDRVEFVPRLGGDKRMHLVPVPWVEYVPVQGTGKLDLTINTAGSADLAELGNPMQYRGIAARVL